MPSRPSSADGSTPPGAVPVEGLSVVGTVETSAPAVTYTAAQQSADWGAPLARGSSIKVRLRQISQAVGDGFPLITTIQI